MFVIMILDVNIFNIRNKLTLIIFSLFINQQVYNSFSFYLFSFSLSFLLNTRKIKIYMKDIMYELLLYLFTYNCWILITNFIDLFILYFLYFHWWCFLSIPLNDYDMQVLAQILYHDYNGLLLLIAFYFWSILYWCSNI